MFYYRANFWDDIDECKKQEQGFIDSKTYEKAAVRLTQYYGTQCLNDLFLAEHEDLITKSDIEEAFNGN